MAFILLIQAIENQDMQVSDVDKHIDSTIYRDAIESLIKDYPNEPWYQEKLKEFEENDVTA